MQEPISRLEVLDAISDAMLYHASKAIILKNGNALLQADEHIREVDRLKRLRTSLMAGVQVEAA